MKNTSAPNILFVFADQMRGMDMGCAGNAQVITPNLDRLAAGGVCVPRHYANCPVCSPNRASMLTGTYATTHRLLVNDRPMRTDLPSLGTLAKAHGYRTGYVGKWHIDGGPRDRFIPPGPRRLGFDDFWAAWNCSHKYFSPVYHLNGDPTPVRHSQGTYEPEVQTALAAGFIEECAAAGAPFCLVLSFGPPHNPYEEVPRRYQDMYDQDNIEFRPNCREIPVECLDPAWEHRRSTRDYYALITSLDDMVGRLLDKLDDLGIADNTLVVFTSDHGEMLWSQGILYKQEPFEEAINIPLLLRLPGRLPAGARYPGLVPSADLTPTLCGLLGWEIPAAMEGVNLAAPLRGETPATPLPESVFLANYGPYVFRPDFPVPEWRGVRTLQHTYARKVGGADWLLFDNESDPFQMQNLAGNPEAGALRDSLAAELDRWLARLGDPFLPEAGMLPLYYLEDHPG